MKNKTLAKICRQIPYIPALRPLAGSLPASILMVQLDYWFSLTADKKQRSFYKFLEPQHGHSMYREGDSWTEELGMSPDEFRGAFDRIGIRYKSYTAYKTARETGDPFQGKFYLSWIDKLKGITWYLRNSDLVDSKLNGLFVDARGEVEQEADTPSISVNGKSPSTEKSSKSISVNGKSTSTETGKVDLRNSDNPTSIYSEITDRDYSETTAKERNNPAPPPSAPVTSHLATEVTNKDSKTKTRPKRVDGFSDDGDINELVAAWNEAIQSTSLSPVAEMTRTRKEQCRQRLKERPLNQWKEVFARVAASRFCKGGNDRGWQVTFSWLVKDDVNAVKVLEGEYDDRRSRLAAPPHRPAVGKPPATAGEVYDNSHLW